MPIAETIKNGEVSNGQGRTDLYTLFREIRASSGGNLNSFHGRGMVLFAEGETARGVYILRTGRAMVSITSSEGRVVILRTVRSGDVLGLNAVLAGSCYDTTVKTLEPCRTDFIPTAHLLDLLETSAGARAILTLLSQEFAELTDRARLLLLPQTASARLARLLCDWSNGDGLSQSSGPRIDKIFTHEEISQMICSSRETVTRLLARMSRRRIIQINSQSILIHDRAALEAMASS